jgi:clan AA aspartic protease (TIGR02281 family)
MMAGLLLGAVFSLHADTVFLKNGRTLEGEVIADDGEAVTVNLGVGQVVLKRAGIERIERDAPEQQDALQEQWAQNYFAHERFTPAGLEDLAAAYRTLQRQHAAARDARVRIEQYRADRPELTRGIKDARRQRIQLAQRLEAADPEAGPAYNRIVRQYNQVTARLDQFVQYLQIGREEEKQQWTIIAEYVNALTRCLVMEKDSRSAWGSEDVEHQRFLQQLREELAALQDEIDERPLTCEERAGQLIVDVMLNDHVKTRLMLDTGATHVSLTRDLADRLQLNLDELSETKVALADGSEADARRVQLESVEVNGFRVADVSALVLMNEASDDVQGLLGMSFLREFLFRVDPIRNQLILGRFAPE